jgi:hypothetical protein
MKLLGIATGNLVRVKESTDLRDINDILDFVRTLDVQAVEVTYAYPEELDVEISPTNLAFLRGLKYKSIHAPFKYVFEDTPQTAAIVQKIKKLYDAIHADYVIMHPSKIKDMSIIKSLNALFENLEIGKGWTYNELKPFFQKHQYGLCLDTTHAMSIDDNELDRLLTFGDRIKEVHLSNYTGETHTDFYNSANYDHILSRIKKLHVPIIIEGALRNDETMVKEIDFVRDYLF